MQTQFRWLLVLPGIILLTACSQEVTFEGNGRTLTYSCDGYESKVESDEDLEVLAIGMRQAVKDLYRIGQQAKAQRIGTKIQTALRERDRKRFEELAVETKCAVEHQNQETGHGEPDGNDAGWSVDPTP